MVFNEVPRNRQCQPVVPTVASKNIKKYGRKLVIWFILATKVCFWLRLQFSCITKKMFLSILYRTSPVPLRKVPQESSPTKRLKKTPHYTVLQVTQRLRCGRHLQTLDDLPHRRRLRGWASTHQRHHICVATSPWSAGSVISFLLNNLSNSFCRRMYCTSLTKAMGDWLPYREHFTQKMVSFSFRP